MCRLKEHPNLCALLDTIAHAEGTLQVAGSDDGYNVLAGGTLFIDYDDHPRKSVEYQPHKFTTAAGRYQILQGTFDAYKKMLGLEDFSPVSQDLIAVHLIHECGAIKLIEQGRFETVIPRINSRWASLPGAGYHQRENNMADLRAVYLQAGGTLGDGGPEVTA